MNSNPPLSLEIGSRVIVTKRVFNSHSSIPTNMVNTIFTVEDFTFDGRKHNRYISSVILRAKDGNKYAAVVDQLSTLNPNFEPAGELITCTSCGGTCKESDLKIVKGIDEKACPFCNTLDCMDS
ncbi:MAG: hypothetical protein MN733_15500 [Nitrososphaera sp.]|nr:hypothetical protein [Nitrososphaera sp.]